MNVTAYINNFGGTVRRPECQKHLKARGRVLGDETGEGGTTRPFR